MTLYVIEHKGRGIDDWEPMSGYWTDLEYFDNIPTVSKDKGELKKHLKTIKNQNPPDYKFRIVEYAPYIPREI